MEEGGETHLSSRIPDNLWSSSTLKEVEYNSSSLGVGCPKWLPSKKYSKEVGGGQVNLYHVLPQPGDKG